LVARLFFENFFKKHLTFYSIGARIFNKFEYHKNDYDEDGRTVKLYRELPCGARQ